MRDVNGQIYWSFADARGFLPQPPSGLIWDDGRRALGLQPSAGLPAGAGAIGDARIRAGRPRIALDAFGTWARADDEAVGVRAGNPEDEDETEIWAAPAGATVADLDWTPAGHLLIAVAEPGRQGHLVWLDRLARFDPVTLAETGFAPDRVSAPPAGGTVWLTDRGRRKARLLAGTPIPDVLDTLPRARDVFRPQPEMADPPRLETPVLSDLDGPEILDAVADETGALVLLRQATGAVDAVIERIAADGRRVRRALQGVVRPFTCAPLGEGRIAVAAAGWTEARAFLLPDLDGPGEQPAALPLGARYPLRDWAVARFASGATGRAAYPVTTGPRPARTLAAVSFAAFASEGATTLEVIDGGAEGFVWHRLYLEASLPKGCAIDVLAAASDDLADLDPAGDGPAATVPWHRHRFGAAGGAAGPVGAWLDLDSERPWAKPALDCPRARDRSGLFTCLVQRSDAADNRRLSGRYLRLRLRFTGNGAATPRLFALRAWGPRFSYRDRFLPELYRIDEGKGAAGSDFLDRYLALFESVLTPIEGEIAAVWRLANPGTIPADGLDWLAGWLGLVPDGALGEAGKRRLIAEAARLAPWRGTLRGLTGMLDIATGGGVAAGRIVVVEHFRMRRTFATLLGADRPPEFDPMTRRPVSGVHSDLGPGFFLGAEDEKLLFALLRPELLDHPLTGADERARAFAQIERLFDDAAHRVTVLVHDETDPDRRGLIARVVRREIPAHVIAGIHDAPASLILGLSALLGVETRAGRPPEIPPVTLGETRIGQGRLRGTPALDQRI